MEFEPVERKHEMAALGGQLTPFSQRCRAVLFESFAVVEVTVVVKVIEDGSVGGCELLQGLDVPEPGHCAFPSSKRLM